MSTTFGASIFAPSPTPAYYQQHGSRLSLYSHQRVSVSKLSEATTAGSCSLRSVLTARVAFAVDTIELSDTEVQEPQSRLTPLINELTDGAPLASAVEPWLDKLSILDWKTLVRDVGDKDWSMAWQLVSHFKEKAPALSDSVSGPEEETKEGTPTEEGEVAEEGGVPVGFSAAEIESTVQEGPSGAPKERSEIQGLYRALAKVLSKNKRTDEMDQLLQQLKAEGVKPVPSLYYIMLAFYLSENLRERCLNLVSEMKQDGVDILPATYEKIAFHFMNKEPIDLTVPTNIMRDLMNKGLPVSQSLLRNLLKAYWRNKDVEGVEETFRAMQVAGQPPDQKAC